MEIIIAILIIVGIRLFNVDRTYAVARVVDGDGLVLSDGRSIRMAGIDAPEADGNQPGWEESRDFLKELIAFF